MDKILITGLFTIITLLAGIKRSMVVVPTGSVAIVNKFGKLDNVTLSPGLNIISPFPWIVSNIVDIRQQTDEITDIYAYSSDMLKVKVSVSVSNTLLPNNVINTITTYGVEYDQVCIYSKIRQKISELFSKWKAQEIFIDRYSDINDILLEFLIVENLAMNCGLDIKSVRVSIPSTDSSDFTEQMKKLALKNVTLNNVIADGRTITEEGNNLIIKENKKGEVEKRKAEHDALLQIIQLDLKMNTTVKNAEIAKVNATANAEEALIIANSDAKILLIIAEAEKQKQDLILESKEREYKIPGVVEEQIAKASIGQASLILADKGMMPQYIGGGHNLFGFGNSIVKKKDSNLETN